MKRVLYGLTLILGMGAGALITPALLADSERISNLQGSNLRKGGLPWLGVAIVDGDGVQITSFGGGTQYTEGDTDASITGNSLLWEGAGNTLTTVKATTPLPVGIFDAGGSQITSFGGGVQYADGDTDATPEGTLTMWLDAMDTIVATSAASPLPVAIISGAGSGGTAANDDSAFTLATTAVTVMGCIEATDSLDAGDLGGVKCGADRELDIDIVSFPDNEPFDVALMAGATTPMTTTQADNLANTLDSLNVTGFNYFFDGSTWDRWTGAVTQGGTWTVQPGNTANTTPWLVTLYQNSANLLPNAAALADNTSNPTTTLVGAMMMCWDTSGSNWDRCVVPQDGSHGSSTAAGGPRMIVEATSSAAGDTNVTDGQDTRLKAGMDGILIERPHANLEDRVNGRAAITDGSSTQVIAAQGASTRFCATTLVVSNSSATNTVVDIRDGTAGTVLMTVPAAANMGGGVVPLAVPLCTTANTIFAADPADAASTIAVTAVGFKVKL